VSKEELRDDKGIGGSVKGKRRRNVEHQVFTYTYFKHVENLHNNSGKGVMHCSLQSTVCHDA